MRKWVVLVALVGCKPHAKTPPNMVSTLEAGDAQHASQFAAGFYDVENNAWRWTGKQFIAVLAPPDGAADHGAAFSIVFTATEPMLKANPSVTVSCAVDGQALAPQTFTAPGKYVMTRQLQPLVAPTAQISCSVDHTFVPKANGDTRELGIIVTRLGLT
jgi:hypothetical protein